MWDYILIGGIVAVCAFYIGRKFYKQCKVAFNPTADLECSCGCSGGCSISACPDKKEKGGKL